MDNVYKAPEAQLLDIPVATPHTTFFVTSISKMSLLFVLTLGLYVLYWAYKQWDSQRYRMPKKIMPVWRSIFAIFFIHSLSRRIADSLHAQGLPAWKPTLAASLFVVLAIATTVLAQIGVRQESIPPLLDLGIMLLQMSPLLPMISIQRQANLASQDPQGRGNSEMSASNIVFIVLGSIIWAIYLLSIAVLAFLGQSV